MTNKIKASTQNNSNKELDLVCRTKKTKTKFSIMTKKVMGII